VILAIVFTGLCILAGVQYYRSSKATAPFDAMEEEARTLCAQCLSLAGGEYPDCNPGLNLCPGLAAAYRRGKVLVVEAGTGEPVGLTMADLSPDLAAVDPEEVGTLVCAGEIREVQVSSYTDRQPGYRRDRDVCIYDVAAEEVILAVTLSGGAPQPVKHTSGPGYGSDPVHGELRSLLEMLPEE
jgi:hypothetical protein